jgi:hypothetical protein
LWWQTGMKIVVTSSFSVIFEFLKSVSLKVCLLGCYTASASEYLATFGRWCLHLQVEAMREVGRKTRHNVPEDLIPVVVFAVSLGTSCFIITLTFWHAYWSIGRGWNTWFFINHGFLTRHNRTFGGTGRRSDRRMNEWMNEWQPDKYNTSRPSGHFI